MIEGQRDGWGLGQILYMKGHLCYLETSKIIAPVLLDVPAFSRRI